MAGEAVQTTGAALVGLVQARQAPVRQALVQGPEAGGRVSGWEKNVSCRTGGNVENQETHLPSRERWRLPW